MGRLMSPFFFVEKVDFQMEIVQNTVDWLFMLVQGTHPSDPLVIKARAKKFDLRVLEE